MVCWCVKREKLPQQIYSPPKCFKESIGGLSHLPRSDFYTHSRAKQAATRLASPSFFMDLQLSIAAENLLNTKASFISIFYTFKTQSVSVLHIIVTISVHFFALKLSDFDSSPHNFFWFDSESCCSLIFLYWYWTHHSTLMAEAVIMFLSVHVVQHCWPRVIWGFNALLMDTWMESTALFGRRNILSYTKSFLSW